MPEPSFGLTGLTYGPPSSVQVLERLLNTGGTAEQRAAQGYLKEYALDRRNVVLSAQRANLWI